MASDNIEVGKGFSRFKTCTAAIFLARHPRPCATTDVSARRCGHFMSYPLSFLFWLDVIVASNQMEGCCPLRQKDAQRAHQGTERPRMTEMRNRPASAATATPALYTGLKPATGLYKPAFEHDACGVGMICSIKNDASHKVVQDGLEILRNLEHRGAVGADPKAGDGAGILIQIPHDFFKAEVSFDLPPEGDYGVGQLFTPKDDAQRAARTAPPAMISSASFMSRGKRPRTKSARMFRGPKITIPSPARRGPLSIRR